MLGAPFGALAAVSFAAVRTGAPLVTGINAVYLYVADLERSMAFYRDVLDIPLAKHPHDPHWAEHAFANGVRFALHATSADGVRGSGTMNLDLDVPDIDTALERCRAAGLDVRDLSRESWGSSFTITDPDGYAIHLYQRPGR